MISNKVYTPIIMALSMFLILSNSVIRADCLKYEPKMCKLDSDSTYEGNGCRTINDVNPNGPVYIKCYGTILKDGEECTEAWFTFLCSLDCEECGVEAKKACRSTKIDMKKKCPKAVELGCFSFGAKWDDVSDADDCRIIESDI